MTERQAEIARVVERYREGIIDRADGELSNAPIGYSAVVTMVFDFRLRPLRLLVTKTPNGYEWAVYAPHYYDRKGHTRPKPRRLV